MRYETTARHSGAFTWPRWVAALFGGWLIISADLWRHTDAQKTNALGCGGLALAFALASFRDSRARYLNAGLGLWLILSTFILGGARGVASSWNELFIGIALVALSALRGNEREEDRMEESPPPPRASAT